MTFEEFIEKAWADHADLTDDVAQRLASADELVTAAAHLPPLARLIVHVHGEHLGRWQDGDELLAALQAHPCARSDATAAGALQVGRAALALCAGERELETPDRAATLASAAAICTGRNDLARAGRFLSQALALAEATEAPPHRALAVAANNLACALRERETRNDDEQRTMLVAAQASRTHWEHAGTWLEVERAEYVLAKAHLTAGDVAAAGCHAKECLAICESHDAPAFERFFAHEAIAAVTRAAGDSTGFAAARAKAQQQYDVLPSDDQAACVAELAALGL